MVNNKNIVCTYGLHAFITEDNKYPLSLLMFQQAKTWGIHFRHLKRPQLNCGGASMAYRVETANQVGGYNLKMKRGTDGFIAYLMMDIGIVHKVTSNKALIYTSNRRTEMDGSLGKAFWVRAKRYFKNAFKYLKTQTEDK
jgi:hypothetical protein